MMAAVARARHDVLKPHVKPHHFGIGSINSPMQCMMKEICAECLQPHVDPATGETRYVFSCFNQDQPLDFVDWSALVSLRWLSARLKKPWRRFVAPHGAARRVIGRGKPASRRAVNTRLPAHE